jgi:hypothetical protein
MITRPLDLASRLAAPPRNYDVFFYVNVGVLAVFFLFFGSRFILAPGLVLGGDAMAVEGARAGASRTTCNLRVLSGGQILTDQGLLEPGKLKSWLIEEKRKAEPNPAVLLLLAGPHVTLDELTRIHSMALSAGFAYSIVAANDAAAPSSAH